MHNLQEKSRLLCQLKTLKFAGGTGNQKEHFSYILICTHRFLFQDIVLLHGYYCTFAPESNRAVTLEQHIIREPARVPKLAVYIPCDVEGVRRGAEQPTLREPDGVEPVPPFPAVGEGDSGHAFSCKDVASVLQSRV
jgi:hypothetical protein